LDALYCKRERPEERKKGESNDEISKHRGNPVKVTVRGKRQVTETGNHHSASRLSRGRRGD